MAYPEVVQAAFVRSMPCVSLTTGLLATMQRQSCPTNKLDNSNDSFPCILKVENALHFLALYEVWLNLKNRFLFSFHAYYGPPTKFKVLDLDFDLVFQDRLTLFWFFYMIPLLEILVSLLGKNDRP